MAAAEIMAVQVQLVLVEALGIHVEELTADVEHSSVRCSSGFRRACKRKPNRPGRSLPQKVSGGGGSSWSCGSRLQWGPLKAIAASVLPHTCWGKQQTAERHAAQERSSREDPRGQQPTMPDRRGRENPATVSWKM